ncbi:hypothetical protein CFC21_035071 [Triticum aestivum]|uniref:Uncharacterized protein n=2 Tax=Triticum aestivum TaxID=4565 RepID=A0A3B6EEK8_WHEAT|nr:hypothetical protein CFC21_035071 [Triticum aestivum]
MNSVRVTQGVRHPDALLERALEVYGNDLDDAIKSLKDLHLMESNQGNLSSTGSTFENGPTAVQPSVEGVVTSGGVDTATEHQPATASHQPRNSGPKWVDLFVREMSNASDMGQRSSLCFKSCGSLDEVYSGGCRS